MLLLSRWNLRWLGHEDPPDRPPQRESKMSVALTRERRDTRRDRCYPQESRPASGKAPRSKDPSDSGLSAGANSRAWPATEAMEIARYPQTRHGPGSRPPGADACTVVPGADRRR